MAHQLKEDLERSGRMAVGAGEYVNVTTAALHLGVSTSFLNKQRMTGDGPPFQKWGKMVKYHLPTLNEWAMSRQRRSTSENRKAG